MYYKLPLNFGNEENKMLREIDWEQIQRDYRLGIKTIRTIAAEFGISHVAIIKKAKQFSWVRDKSYEVIEKTRAKLISADEYPDKKKKKKSVTGQIVEITENDVEKAVQINIAVIRSHRRSISQTQKIFDILTEQLLNAVKNRDSLTDAVKLADENAHIKAAMRRACSLPSQAVVMRDLSGALKNLIFLERQAFGIDKIDQPTGDPISDLLTEVVKRARPLFSTKDE